MVHATYNDQSCRVFLCNLAWKTSYQDVKDAFKAEGLKPLRVDILRDGKGSSRGVGIAVLPSKSDAAEAIKKITGKQVQGRTILAREDKKAEFKPRWDPRDRNSPARKSRNGTRQLRKRKHPAAVELPEQPQQ